MGPLQRRLFGVIRRVPFFLQETFFLPKPIRTRWQGPSGLPVLGMVLIEEEEEVIDPAPAAAPAVVAPDAPVAAVASEQPGSSYDDADEARDPEDDARLLAQAQEAKERGNEHFKKGELPEALECYSEAIELAAPTEAGEVGVFFANRAAVFARMGQHQAVCDDCDAALARQPEYVKALVRRAQAREALDQPSEALADMKRALEIEPGAKAAAAAVPRLQAAADAKLEQQKEEMLGKLKELGNGILGKFGMSLDNFKAEKDPATGSYNISFQQ